MKPTFETNCPNNGGDDALASRASLLPITDWSYQSVTLGGYSGRGTKATPSFLNISRDYFKYEGPQTFAGEASFFVVIIATAAWPVVQGAYAIMDLIRAFGTL
jgi:hypothetical protein